MKFWRVLEISEALLRHGVGMRLESFLKEFLNSELETRSAVQNVSGLERRVVQSLVPLCQTVLLAD
jgi:hypothetical protein